MNDGNGEFVLSGLYDDLLDEEQEPWTGPSQSAILSTTAADGSITTRRRESQLEDFGEEQEQGSGSNQDLTSTMTTRGLGDLRHDIRNISSRHSDHATDLRDDIRDMTSGSRYARNDLQNDTPGITSFSRRLSNIRDGLRVLATSEPRTSLSPSSDREHDLRDEFRNMMSETRQSSWDLRNDIRLAQIGSHRDLRVDIERMNIPRSAELRPPPDSRIGPSPATASNDLRADIVALTGSGQDSSPVHSSSSVSSVHLGRSPTTTDHVLTSRPRVRTRSPSDPRSLSPPGIPLVRQRLDSYRPVYRSSRRRSTSRSRPQSRHSSGSQSRARSRSRSRERYHSRGGDDRGRDWHRYRDSEDERRGRTRRRSESRSRSLVREGGGRAWEQKSGSQDRTRTRASGSAEGPPSERVRDVGIDGLTSHPKNTSQKQSELRSQSRPNSLTSAGRGDEIAVTVTADAQKEEAHGLKQPRASIAAAPSSSSSSTFPSRLDTADDAPAASATESTSLLAREEQQEQEQQPKQEHQSTPLAVPPDTSSSSSSEPCPPSSTTEKPPLLQSPVDPDHDMAMAPNDLPARYFLMRCREKEFEEAQRQNMWPTNPLYDQALRQAYESGGAIFFLFTMRLTREFCGLARMASHITWMPEKTIFSRSPKREQKMKLDWITSGSRIGYEDVTKPMGLPAYAVIRRHGEELDAGIGHSIQDLLASDKARRVEATIKEQDDSTQNMDNYMKREESASRQGEGSKQRYYDDTKDMDAAERTRRDGASRSRRVTQPIPRTAHESRRAPTWVDQRSQRQHYRQRTFSGPPLRVVHPLPPRPKPSPTQPSPATFPSNDASSSSNNSREKRRARFSPLNSPIYSPVHSPFGSPIGSPLGSPIGSPIMSPMEPHDEDAAWSAKPSEVKISLVPAGLSKTQRKKQRKLARMQPLDM